MSRVWSSVTSNSIRSYRDHENQQNPGKHDEEHRGLWMLFTVHRLTGLSFLGASITSQPLSLFYKLVLFLWNIAVFGFSYYTFYISIVYNTQRSGYFENYTSHAFFGNGQQWSSLILYLRFSALAIYHLFSYVINLYIGVIARPLLSLLDTEVLPRVEPKAEHRIGHIIVLVQLILIITLMLVLQTLIYFKFGHFLFIRGVEVVINLFSLFAPIALIAYLNLSLAHILVASADQQEELGQYIERLLLVGSIMKRATRLLGPAIIVLIVNSMVVCICTVCLCIANWTNTYFLSTWAFLVYSIVLVMLVIVSSYAYETSKVTSDRFKQKLLISLVNYKSTTSSSSSRGQHSEHNSNSQNKYHEAIDCHLISSQLTILASLEENIRMAPLNLFFLTRSYILTFLAFMLSYSVILVQTSKSTILDIDHIRQNCTATFK